MIIYVKLLKFHHKTFTYRVPSHLIPLIALNKIVCVPLRNKIIPAVICSIQTTAYQYPFEIKDIISVYQIPDDQHYHAFLKKIEHLYQIEYNTLINRIAQFLIQSEQEVLALPQIKTLHDKEIIFSYEQQQVIKEITTYLHQQQYAPFILHGVTGSGKTEIYKHIITHMLNENKSVIIMLPEVSLALRFEQILSQWFNNHLVIGFHCASSTKQKQNLWNALLEKKSVIILGVHLPVLLPIANLGCIIVDEEHDVGYQEKKHPKLHSRDLAILKAYEYQIPIILGSATPSIQSLYNAQHKKWPILKMKNRYQGAFPQIITACLKTQKKRKHFWFTDELISAIQDRLEKKEQTIIFLNRRGFSFFVQCICSYVIMCPNCSVSLTLHSGSLLLCHYCNYTSMIPNHCPECNQPNSSFLKKGIGTQQVVALLQKIFPQAIIERADLESTSKKRSWNQTVLAMQEGNIDILVGTQSITKGYHFEKVTLVGVLWADLNLHFPMYNATEVCLQQLIQVAGRAGRQSQNSLVIIQSFDMHPIFQFLNEQEYEKFYDFEMQKRITVGYPPYKHIAEIEIKDNNQDQLVIKAQELVNILHKNTNQNIVEIFGPIQSIIHKIQGIYTQKIYLKSFSRNALIHTYALIKNHNALTFFTIDPVQ